jgi:predicted RNA-binding Zn-ribbon protein involved in translation (DUF1610 family)
MRYGGLMKFVLSKLARVACPRCGSPNIYRSKRRGFIEAKLGSIFDIKPYRCDICNYRHFRFVPIPGTSTATPPAD